MNRSAAGGVRIRLAGIEDLASLVSLNSHVQELHARQRPDLFHDVKEMPGVEDHFTRLCGSPSDVVFLAEIDEQPVGLVHAEAQRRPENTFSTAVARGYIHQISVDPAYRRRGVGRALMAKVEDWAREQGLISMGLDTWSFNPEAKTFFESLGYTPYNVRLSRSL